MFLITIFAQENCSQMTGKLRIQTDKQTETEKTNREDKQKRQTEKQAEWQTGIKH